MAKDDNDFIGKVLVCIIVGIITGGFAHYIETQKLFAKYEALLARVNNIDASYVRRPEAQMLQKLIESNGCD